MQAEPFHHTPFDDLIDKRQPWRSVFRHVQRHWRLPWYLSVSAVIGLMSVGGAVAMLKLSVFAYRAVPPLEARQAQAAAVPVRQPAVQSSTVATSAPYIDPLAQESVAAAIEPPDGAPAPRRILVQTPAFAPVVKRASVTTPETRMQETSVPITETYPVVAASRVRVSARRPVLRRKTIRYRKPRHQAPPQETMPQYQAPGTAEPDRYPAAESESDAMELPPVSAPRADHPVWHDESQPSTTQEQGSVEERRDAEREDETALEDAD